MPLMAEVALITCNASLAEQGIKISDPIISKKKEARNGFLFLLLFRQRDFNRLFYRLIADVWQLNTVYKKRRC